MTGTLTHAIELAKMLPEDEQEALGAVILAEMQSEERWKGLFESSQDELERMADQALAEHSAGTTRPWP